MTGSRFSSGLAGLALIGSFLCGCTNTQQSAVPSSEPLALTVIHAMQQTQPTTLPSRVYNWNEIAVQNTASGQRRTFFDSSTATLNNLEMHVSTLNPGQEAHPPHRHPHEEMMLVKEGSLEATINGKTFPMPTGSALFVAPNDLHGVKNVGTIQATYFVLTWRTPKTGGAQ